MKGGGDVCHRGLAGAMVTTEQDSINNLLHIYLLYADLWIVLNM